MKYKEIFKLKEILEKAGIPFEWTENWGYSEEQLEKLKQDAPELIEHYQICYPIFDPKYRWISVIEGWGTYGAERDRLEIMGGFTPWERYTENNTVIGGLTAKNVFNRIQQHYKENKEEIEKWKKIKHI